MNLPWLCTAFGNLRPCDRLAWVSSSTGHSWNQTIRRHLLVSLCGNIFPSCWRASSAMCKRDPKPRLTSRVSPVGCAYVHSQKTGSVYATTKTLGCKKGTLHVKAPCWCCSRTPCLNSFKLGPASGAAPSHYGVFEVTVRIAQNSTSNEHNDFRLLLAARMQLPAAIFHRHKHSKQQNPKCRSSFPHLLRRLVHWSWARRGRRDAGGFVAWRMGTWLAAAFLGTASSKSWL